MKPVVAYTDGSAWEGKGGVGVVIVGERSILSISCFVNGKDVTNQSAELFAALVALMHIRVQEPPTRIIIVSDSAYLVNCFRQGWIAKWRRKDWKKGKREIANREMWETLEAWVELHDVEFRHTRGHGRGDPRLRKYNDQADNLARTAREEQATFTHRRRRR